MEWTLTKQKDFVTSKDYYTLKVDGTTYGFFGKEAFKDKSTEEILERIVMMMNDAVKLYEEITK